MLELGKGLSRSIALVGRGVEGGVSRCLLLYLTEEDLTGATLSTFLTIGQNA